MADAVVELELYRAVIVLLNVVQLAVLAAILKWVRGNGHAAGDDLHDQIERYLSRRLGPPG